MACSLCRQVPFSTAGFYEHISGRLLAYYCAEGGCAERIYKEKDFDRRGINKDV